MDIQQLKTKFEDLKYKDINYQRFGSGKHLYRSKKVSSEEIDNFETNWEIELPSDYKQFLLEIGYGAGPYYGIWNLDEIDNELFEIKEIEEEENIELSPANLFPFNEIDISDLNKKIPNHLEQYKTLPAIETFYPSNGSIPICTHGCTFWSCLVITGELRGTVWDVACPVGYEGWWTPAGFSKESNTYYSVKFEEWIENWIQDEPVYTSSSYSNFTNNIIEFITNIFK